jgi:hypothetical protein
MFFAERSWSFGTLGLVLAVIIRVLQVLLLNFKLKLRCCSSVVIGQVRFMLLLCVEFWTLGLGSNPNKLHEIGSFWISHFLEFYIGKF